MKSSSKRGMYTVEWALLMAAVVVVATVVMREYVREAVNAGSTGAKVQMQQAMTDNRP